MKIIWKIIRLTFHTILRIKWVRKITLILSIILLFWMLFLNFVEPTKIGIARSFISGKTWLQDGNGWNFTAPWVYVPEIDIRPMRVEVTSAGHGFSAKLVQFNKKYWEDFANTEGVYYYWIANRISFNFGYDEEHRGMKDIMRGYAYSPKDYSFIDILDEYEQE